MKNRMNKFKIYRVYSGSIEAYAYLEDRLLYFFKQDGTNLESGVWSIRDGRLFNPRKWSPTLRVERVTDQDTIDNFKIYLL